MSSQVPIATGVFDSSLRRKGLKQPLKESQRDVVYLGWPVSPSYISPNVGEGCCGVSANEYSCAHEAQINFGELTPYLTYATTYLYYSLYFIPEYSVLFWFPREKSELAIIS